jgi:hypothetical protein
LLEGVYSIKDLQKIEDITSEISDLMKEKFIIIKGQVSPLSQDESLPNGVCRNGTLHQLRNQKLSEKVIEKKREFEKLKVYEYNPSGKHQRYF